MAVSYYPFSSNNSLVNTALQSNMYIRIDMASTPALEVLLPGHAHISPLAFHIRRSRISYSRPITQQKQEQKQEKEETTEAIMCIIINQYFRCGHVTQKIRYCARAGRCTTGQMGRTMTIKGTECRVLRPVNRQVLRQFLRQEQAHRDAVLSRRIQRNSAGRSRRWSRESL
jgi:hypothetical protein